MSLTVGELKEVLKDLPDDMEVFKDSNDETHYLAVSSIFYKPRVVSVSRINGMTTISMSESDKSTKNVLLFID